MGKWSTRATSYPGREGKRRPSVRVIRPRVRCAPETSCAGCVRTRFGICLTFSLYVAYPGTLHTLLRSSTDAASPALHPSTLRTKPTCAFRASSVRIPGVSHPPPRQPTTERGDTLRDPPPSVHAGVRFLVACGRQRDGRQRRSWPVPRSGSDARRWSRDFRRGRAWGRRDATRRLHV